MKLAGSIERRDIIRGGGREGPKKGLQEADITRGGRVEPTSEMSQGGSRHGATALLTGWEREIGG